MLTAAELHDRAKRATNAGRHERALALIARARERQPDADLAALLDGTAAYAEVERGHLLAALALCDTALGRAASDEVRGIVSGQRAIVHTRLGHVDAALADFHSAIEGLAGRPEFRGRAQLNRGNLHLDRGRVVAAASDYAGAVASFDEAGLATQRAKADHNLGYALMLTGDLVGALHRMGRARDQLGSLSAVSRAIGAMDHAEALFQAGLSREGEAELRAAIAVLARSKARRVRAEARLALARRLAEHDPVGAQVQARAAARAYQEMGARRQALAAEALALGCGLRRGRPVESAALAALASLREAGLDDEAAGLVLDVLAARLASGRIDEVRGVRLPRATSLRRRLQVADVAAARASTLGRRGEALAALRSALDEAQALRASVGSLDLATALSTRTRLLSRRGLELAIASGRAELVYEWSERGRAHASRLVPVRPAGGTPASPELAELRLLELTRSDASRQAVLRTRVREEAWQLAGAAASLEVADLDAVRAGLDAAGAALVAHLVASGRLWALVVGDGVRLVDCGPDDGLAAQLDALAADLDGVASPASDGVRSAVLGSLRATCAAVSARAVAPVLDLTGGRRWVVTPSAPLHALPWGLLPELAGRPVTVARSATAWLGALQDAGRTPALSQGLRVVAIAGPGLTHAEDEARAVVRPWGGVALTGARATVAATLDALEGADIVHLATHGRHFPENPLFSRIDLADGPLFGYDLDRVARLPQVVVLSACDVGQESIRGDDLLGLPLALLHAGVQTVIAPVSRVNDEGSRRLGESLHRALKDGASPPEGLARALIETGGVLPYVCWGRG